MSDALERLHTLQAGDLPVHGGRTLAYVYDSGLPDIDRIGREAVAAAAATNGLDPTAFPSLLRMENDLVGFGLRLLDAPDTGVGTVTSGGTESVLLAVQTARDGRPEVERPAMVVPSTRHAAFDKAAHYFGVEKRVVPVGADFRADVAATAAAVDELGDRVVLLVASAPSYAHGVIDPVPEIAALAARRGIRCHVDACIGGWVLPYAARLGRPVAPWTFAVDGVTSISVDLHKYGYAPKGTSLLLHRTPELRRPQFFASAEWPGYTMLNSTMQSTKSGGPLAGAWAVVESLGDDGYLTLARQLFDAVDAIVAGIEAAPALSLVARPDSSLVTFETDGTCDAFTVSDEMRERGWYVQPQMSYAGRGPNIHLSVSAGTLAHVDDFLSALGEAVAAAQQTGPVTVDPGIAAYIESLDPAALTDADFDGLLAASGLVGENSGGGLELPSRMAEINAMLDLAAPAMREALLVAFLDRLARPTD
ncbi:pyridoxal phosphate-dependent decarboxylase family protein [Nocardioides dilutus]